MASSNACGVWSDKVCRRQTGGFRNYPRLAPASAGCVGIGQEPVSGLDVFSPPHMIVAADLGGYGCVFQIQHAFVERGSLVTGSLAGVGLTDQPRDRRAGRMQRDPLSPTSTRASG